MMHDLPPDSSGDHAEVETNPQLTDAERRAGWDDLVLPVAQKDALRQIAAQAREQKGLNVLFTGDSGTGKTMAAETLARALERELYRVELSAVVSKYIGETEKNLAHVFDAAEERDAILLFDEADALFGKRTEVQDSHDRYANIEEGYLLQRMEAYRGLIILTIKSEAAIDPVVHRRLRHVVRFPFPDDTLREAIWHRVLHERSPTGEVDPRKLARLHATGGSIRNIARHAAFRAAERGEPVSMAHLQHAAREEAAEHGRSLSEAEIRDWV